MNKLEKIKSYLDLQRDYLVSNYKDEEKKDLLIKFERENSWVLGFDIPGFLIQTCSELSEQVEKLKRQITP